MFNVEYLYKFQLANHSNGAGELPKPVLRGQSMQNKMSEATPLHSSMNLLGDFFVNAKHPSLSLAGAN